MDRSNLNGWIDVIDALNSNAGAITALLTAILVLTTIFYAAVTYFLFRETRLGRLATAEPEVVAFLRPHEKHISAIDMHIQNVGLGPAFDVKVCFEISTENAEKYGLSHLPAELKHLTNVMPSASTVKTNLGTHYELVEKIGELTPFTVKIEYKDLRGRQKTFQEAFSLRALEWITVLGKTHPEVIAEGVEGVQDAARALQEIARNTKRSDNPEDLSPTKM